MYGYEPCPPPHSSPCKVALQWLTMDQLNAMESSLGNAGDLFSQALENRKEAVLNGPCLSHNGLMGHVNETACSKVASTCIEVGNEVPINVHQVSNINNRQMYPKILYFKISGQRHIINLRAWAED